MLSGRRAYRRSLPHYQSEFKKYFVTAVTLRRWVLPPLARDLVMEQIVRAHSEVMYCYTAVVMPDHIHLVMMPLLKSAVFSYAIADVMKSIKGASSRYINRTALHSGAVWQDEFWDHELRSQESLRAKCDYVRQNPVRAGLVDHPEDYRWLFEPIRNAPLNLAEWR